MQSSPSTIYSQSADKQRIVVIGRESLRIAAMVMHVLNEYKRKFDYSTPAKESLSGAAVVIIAPDPVFNNYLDYKHHVLIISQLSSDDQSRAKALADTTPKSGIVIYDETDEVAKSLAKQDRTDVSVIPFSAARYELEKGKIVLITSTNEKFITSLTDPADMKSVSAAKELLKKIGISSGQFYRAISSFQ